MWDLGPLFLEQRLSNPDVDFNACDVQQIQQVIKEFRIHVENTLVWTFEAHELALEKERDHFVRHYKSEKEGLRKCMQSEENSLRGNGIGGSSLAFI